MAPKAQVVRGWMTIQQAADGLGLDVPTLLKLAGADAATAATIDPSARLSDLEAKLADFLGG